MRKLGCFLNLAKQFHSPGSIRSRLAPVSTLGTVLALAICILTTTLVPLPAMAAEDKLFDYLVRLASVLNASQEQKYRELDSLCSKMYDDAIADGLDKPDATSRLKCTSGLDKVTPLIRTPEKYGNVYQRLFIEIRRMRGTARSVLGKYSEGGKELQELSDKYPDFTDGRIALAMHYRRIKEYDKALLELDEAEKINPNYISTCLSRMLVYQETGNTEKQHQVTEEFNKLRVAREKEVADFMQRTPSFDVKLEEEQAKKMLQVHPTQPGPIAEYAAIIAANRLQDAKKYASIAVVISPQQPFGYACRAEINLDSNQFQASVDDATKALALDPKDLDLRITRALAYLNMNRTDLALNDLNFAISKVPDFALPYSYRASIYTAQGDYKKALVDLKKAVRIKRDDPVAAYNFGVCYSRMKMYQNAQHAFEDMVRIERNDTGFASPVARTRLGRCYQNQNKNSLAKKEFDKALIASAKFPECLLEKSATATRHGFRDQELKNSLQTGKLPKIPFAERECIEDSSALLSRKIELVPRNISTRYDRGLVHACLNQNDAAAIDFDRFVSTGKENLDRAIIMAYLCHDRAKNEYLAKKSLKDRLPKLRDRSYSSLAHFLLGDIGESQVSKQTGSTTDDTVLHCDLGYYFMSRGDRSKAKPHIEWVLLHGDRNTVEYVLALTELQRMCGSQ